MTINEKLKQIAENVPKVYASGQDTAPLQELSAVSNGVYAPEEGISGFGKVKALVNPKQRYLTVLGTAAGIFSGAIRESDSPFLSCLDLDYTGVTDFSSAFQNCTALTSVELKNAVPLKASNMFNGCTSLLTIPEFDTSKITLANRMFAGTKALTVVESLDLSSATGTYGVYELFYNSGITELHELKIDSATYLHGMFQSCKSLTYVPLFDTSKATDMGLIFAGCNSLRVIPAYDLRSAGGVFNNPPLYDNTGTEECWFRNLSTSIRLDRNQLIVDCLIHFCYEARQHNSTCQLVIGSTNLAKLADVYVRVLDESEITDEMRAEDDLVDEKLPFVTCESTDEGAMLITDYMPLKNWSIA